MALTTEYMRTSMNRSFREKKTAIRIPRPWKTASKTSTSIIHQMSQSSAMRLSLEGTRTSKSRVFSSFSRPVVKRWMRVSSAGENIFRVNYPQRVDLEECVRRDVTVRFGRSVSDIPSSDACDDDGRDPSTRRVAS